MTTSSVVTDTRRSWRLPTRVKTLERYTFERWLPAQWGSGWEETFNVQTFNVLTIWWEVPERDHLVDVRPLTPRRKRPPLLAKTFKLGLETGAIRWVGIL